MSRLVDKLVSKLSVSEAMAEKLIAAGYGTVQEVRLADSTILASKVVGMTKGDHEALVAVLVARRPG